MSVSSIKLTMEEVCKFIGLDIANDRRNRFFWNSSIQNKVLITEELLDWCGYSGEEYKTKKLAITKLLKVNPNIQFEEVKNPDHHHRKDYMLNGIDFQTLLMQMRSSKAIEIRELYAIMKEMVVKFIEYEKMYEKRQREMLLLQNYDLQKMMQKQDGVLKRQEEAIKQQNEIYQLALESKQHAEEREHKAEEERKLAQERERKAEEERKFARIREIFVREEFKKADEERKLAQERERKAEEYRKYTIDKLETEIVPKVVPNPINKGKEHIFALFRKTPDQWYIMRRQRHGYMEGRRLLMKHHKSAVELKIWEHIPHAIDVGNVLKKKFRQVKWNARGNTIEKAADTDETMSDETIIAIFDKIIEDGRNANCAQELADYNKNI